MAKKSLAEIYAAAAKKASAPEAYIKHITNVNPSTQAQIELKEKLSTVISKNPGLVSKEFAQKILAKHMPETIIPEPTAETEAPKAEQSSAPKEEAETSQQPQAKASEDVTDDNTEASSNSNEPQEELKVNFFSAVWSAFKELLEKYHFIEAENDLLNDKGESMENDYTKFGSEYNEQSEIIDNLEQGFNTPNNE